MFPMLFDFAFEIAAMMLVSIGTLLVFLVIAAWVDLHHCVNANNRTRGKSNRLVQDGAGNIE